MTRENSAIAFKGTKTLLYPRLFNLATFAKTFSKLVTIYRLQGLDPDAFGRLGSALHDSPTGPVSYDTETPWYVM